MKSVRYFSILILFCLSKVTLAQTKNNETIWITFEQLNDSLQINPKKVLLFIHTDWCSYCKKMMKETFNDSRVHLKLTNDYHCINIDAENVAEINFEGIIYHNDSLTKKRGQYHQLAKLFIKKQNPTFPITILLNSDFSITNYKDKYLSINELLKIL